MIGVGGKQQITYFEVSLSFYMLHIGNTSRGSESCVLLYSLLCSHRQISGGQTDKPSTVEECILKSLGLKKWNIGMA